MLYAIIAAVVLVVLIFLYMLSRVVVVPSNLTGLVAGSTRNGEIKIIRPGGRDFVLPIIQSIQYLPFTQNTIGFQVTAEDENKINVNVSAVAAVKVGDSDEQVRAAAKRFLGKPNTDQAIADSARNALIGSLRSIIGHMTVTDLISDRDALQRNVFDDAKSIMANMGLEIDMLQVSEITDAGGYIESLGVPEQQRVEKDARIARANAEREAKDAEVTSRQQIAERERDLSLRQAQLKAETDKAQADADSAGPIARAAKEREIAIIGQEAAEAKAALTERELDSTVRKPADAARYQREQEAQASKTEALLRAQAEAERLQRRIETRTGTIARLFDAVCEVLLELGYLRPVDRGHPERELRVTGAGKVLARIYAERDLLIAECLRTGVFEDLSAAELAGALSACVYEPRLSAQSIGLPVAPGSRLGQCLRAQLGVSHRIHDLESLARIEASSGAEPALAGAVQAWCDGAQLADILDATELTAGDFVRWCKQLLDVVGQIASLSPPPDATPEQARAVTDLSMRAAEASLDLNRGVVSWSAV